jgi:hypothetical protein
MRTAGSRRIWELLALPGTREREAAFSDQIAWVLSGRSATLSRWLLGRMGPKRAKKQAPPCHALFALNAERPGRPEAETFT